MQTDVFVNDRYLTCVLFVYLTHFLFATKLKFCIHQLKNNSKASGYLLIFEVLFVGTVLVRLCNLNNSL